MRLTNFLPILLCGGSALASPLVTAPGVLVARSKIVTAEAAILEIMNTSKTCDDTTECRTAAQAAPFLIESMKGHSLGQIAAMLALIAVESVEMKFKHNVSPGRPGQGTSNMMMPDFVKMYATDLFGAQAVEGKSPVDVLALVTPDKYNFGSAPWFLKTQCPAEVSQNLLGGTEDGWIGYMRCVLGLKDGDPIAQERQDYWVKAQKAFGLNGF